MISPWKRSNIQRSFDSDPNYTRCAKECHVDPKTVHKYTDKDVVPKRTTQREYRTRIAPLDEYWPEIKGLLENDPKLKPYAILEFLLDKYPTKFDPSWRRTLERRIGRWAIENQGKAKRGQVSFRLRDLTPFPHSTCDRRRLTNYRSFVMCVFKSSQLGVVFSILLCTQAITFGDNSVGSYGVSERSSE